MAESDSPAVLQSPASAGSASDREEDPSGLTTPLDEDDEAELDQFAAMVPLYADPAPCSAAVTSEPPVSVQARLHALVVRPEARETDDWRLEEAPTPSRAELDHRHVALK